MRRFAILAAIAGLLLSGLPASFATGEEEPPAEKKPTVVKRIERKPDLRVKDRKRFVPTGTPSVTQVYRIIRIEAKRWGASEARLRCRISGESGFRWYAENGQYKGLGQFAYSTFTRGLSTIQTRRVKKHAHFRIWRRSRIVTWWSDGTKTKKKGPRYRVRVHRVYVGKIAKPTPWLHGWAQVRIMAQAMVGRSAVNDGEWEVRC